MATAGPASGGKAAEANLILGTAGHIDHGKTQLTRALTGVDTDRLAEEKRRGISIVLGFAEIVLPSGARMGVVDVPGHERFVKNMVAGATGIDVVLLVVAADDGVMPQTREHLAIIDLLGVDNGVVAITKADLVDEDWLELVREDVKALLEGTSLSGSPVLPVSSKTGQGLDELRVALDEAAARPSVRRHDLPMRLPIDRVFTIAGSGTVVTGTLWSGAIAPEDTVQLMPGGRTARVRSVQVHGTPVERALAGHRVAVNLTGLDREEVLRGQTLAAPGSLPDTVMLDARLKLLASAKELKTRSKVHLHHGTTSTVATVVLLEGDVLAPSGSGFAQLHLERPIAARYEDRFILRSASSSETIGGGVVLDVAPDRHAHLKERELRRLEALLAHDVPAVLEALFAAHPRPMTLEELSARAQIGVSEIAPALEALGGLTEMEVSGAHYVIPETARGALLDGIEQALKRHHEQEPKSTGMEKQALRDRVLPGASGKLWDAVLGQAVAEGKAQLAGNLVRHPKAAVSALAEEEETAGKLLDYFASAGVHPEDAKNLPTAAGVDATVVRKVLPKLAAEGSLVRATPEMYFAAATIERVRSELVAYLEEHGEITAATFRDLIGAARKHAVPLLEYFDSRGLTVRQGDVRRLKR
jgi:selenocysteine-specific elongation factor